MITIDKTARIARFTDIENSLRGNKIIIGKNTTLDNFIKLKFAGGNGDIIIGENVCINSGCVLYSGNGITIGNHVMIAANCTLAATNHAYQNKELLIAQQGFLPSKGGIIIEDDVWIAANCVLLDGAKIRRGAVVGAGSLVRGEVLPFHIVAGNPLKILGKRK